MKIFENKGFNIRGRVLSLDTFRLIRDLEDPKFNTESEEMQTLLAKAEEDLEKDIPTLPLSKYRAYLENGSTTIYSKPYRDRMSMLSHMAIAEKVEGNGRFIDKIADLLWAMCEESTWMLPEHTPHRTHEAARGSKVPPTAGNKYGHGLELGAAYRAANIAMAYSWFKDKLDEISPFINERILFELKERITDPFLNDTFWWEGVSGNRVNNWCPWIVCNVLTVVALTEADMERREKTVELAMQYLDNFINWCPEDGGCDEGPTYWNAGVGCLFDSLELLEDLTDGYVIIYDEPIIKALGEYEARANITGKYFVNFADSRSTCMLDGNMIMRYGQKCGSKILIAFAKNMLNMRGPVFDTALISRSYRSLTAPLLDFSAIAPRAARNTYFKNLEIMILRDSRNPDEGMFLAMKGGHNGESHNHNDVGSFIVYKNGQPVLIDAGVGEYTRQTFSKDRYKIWSMQSLYHNVASFGGLGQTNGAQYKATDAVYNKAARTLSLELREAYAPEVGVESYKRISNLNEGVVTVTDKVRLNEEKEIDFIFMTHREPKLERGGKILLTEGCVLNYDTSLTAEIEIFDPVGMDTKTLWDTEVLYRIHLKTTAKECEYTFTVTNQ